MSKLRPTRRDFLATSAALAAAGLIVRPSGRTMADETKSPNERPRFGSIGVGSMGSGDAQSAMRYGDLLAVCDVDRDHLDKAKNHPKIGKGKVDAYDDYRRVLDRKDIDFVTISTPDHWHTRVALAALAAGKDVYCQKPLTLTIEEGKQLRDAVHRSGRVLQVGTQQRSEDKYRFLTAVAMVRLGRIGKVKRVSCAIGGSPAQKMDFGKTAPPAGLDWDTWQGQTPNVDYIPERCHYEFRWWYEYSGGKLTDWGAHHVDIAQWAIGMENSGPSKVEVGSVQHPVPFQDGRPTVDDRYNTATSFQVRCRFPDDVEMLIRDDTENGILFEGEKGTFFVSRSELSGPPVDDLAKNPIPESVLVALRKGKRLDTHMANFVECARDRSTPVSDVDSHHRALTTCHLANIAMRLGRDIAWDPIAEQIVGDDAANAWQRREQRKGFETVV